MESKDLKNSEELKRPINDDTLLATEAEKPASPVDDETVEVSVAEKINNEVEEDRETKTDDIEDTDLADDKTAEEQTSSDNHEVMVNEEVVEGELSELTGGEEPVVSGISEDELLVEGNKPITDLEQETTVEPETERENTVVLQDEEKSLEMKPEETKEDVSNKSEAQFVTEKEEPVIEKPLPEDEKSEEDSKEISDDDEDEVEDEAEDEEGEGFDYSQLTQIELINLLREQVESGQTRDRTINLIIAAYNQKVKDLIAEKRQKFEEEGGNPDEFIADEDPYENDIRELIKKHRQARFEQAKKLEAEKEINLQKKYAIIEEIKNLLNAEESINKTFQEFRELQRQWYEIGPVPQAKMKDLWDTYHFHVENFYDYIKINKELRDLDLRKNLEMKISLCEKAEELLLEPSVIRAFNSLQKFHEQWREIGPVPRDKKDEIWERFKAVTTAINQKHQEFFDKRKNEQKRNLEAKIALCEKVEEICNMNLDSHREWDEKSKQLIELQKVWRTIGFAPKRDNNKIYDRFRNACDLFFNKKRDYYSQNKELQNKNMQMKIDLCLEAEALKESTDWKKTTQQFIDIQRRWKEIGPVPRKHSDQLWKRFRAACDYFFERKSHHFSDIDDEQGENLKLKKGLIAEVEAYVPGSDVSESLKALREFQRRWTEIGHVPMKEKDAIQNRFRNAINKHFDALKLDNGKRDSINFRSKIANMTENQKGLSKVRQEREKYMAKLKQLETDLTLLDNNIGFFANSKNAQALIADVNQKIEDTRSKIEMLKEKIRIIDELDKTEY